jgi:hypothetical protein
MHHKGFESNHATSHTDRSLAEYTAELLNVLHVLAVPVEMEPAQARQLEMVCEGTTLEFQAEDHGT